MSRGLMRYKRVAQRLRERFQDKSFKIQDLEEAIFIECGTDPRTVKVGITRLIRLGLIIEIDKVREFGVHPYRRFKLPKEKKEYY